MQALDLDPGTIVNPVMAAFGVKISAEPLKVLIICIKVLQAPVS